MRLSIKRFKLLLSEKKNSSKTKRKEKKERKSRERKDCFRASLSLSFFVSVLFFLLHSFLLAFINYCTHVIQ